MKDMTDRDQPCDRDTMSGLFSNSDRNVIIHVTIFEALVAWAEELTQQYAFILSCHSCSWESNPGQNAGHPDEGVMLNINCVNHHPFS